MLATVPEAKARLEAEGLHVAYNNPHSLWIAANLRDVGAGVKLSNDACCLTERANQWVAVFPADGASTYEIPGSLSDLVSLITTVYADYRQAGGQLRDAVSRAVPDVARFVGGSAHAHV